MAGIYVHIPFCRQNCHYCDFYFSVSLNYKEQVIDAINKELIQRCDYLNNELVETIYMGGGTPSVLSPDEVNSILQTIYDHFNVSKNPEITLEANPDDISFTYIKHLLGVGINRLSVGIQSFADKELVLMNRTHNSEQAVAAIKTINKAGIQNFSTDLIYAIPGSKAQTILKNVKTLLQFDIPHISIYHLTYEDGTIFKHKVRKQRLLEIGEEGSIQQYELIRNLLASHHYDHYEISNFAKKGCISKHNTSYWFGKKYLGIGPSAHSYNGKSRQWNIPAIGKYLSGINNGTMFYEKEKLDERTRYNEFLMLRLRTAWGIDHQELNGLFGTRAFERFMIHSKKFVNKGYLNQSIHNTRIKKEKFIMSDFIIAQMFEN